MWGKILIGFALVSMINCHGAAITCNPNLSNPGCPVGPNGVPRICDPTGICQIQCNNSIDCTDPGTICDHSSPLLPLCQKDCSVSGCQTGQICRNHNITPSSTADATESQQTCKAVCFDQGKACAKSDPHFTCYQTGEGNVNICWAPPSTTTS